MKIEISNPPNAADASKKFSEHSARSTTDIARLSDPLSDRMVSSLFAKKNRQLEFREKFRCLGAGVKKFDELKEKNKIPASKRSLNHDAQLPNKETHTSKPEELVKTAPQQISSYSKEFSVLANTAENVAALRIENARLQAERDAALNQLHQLTMEIQKKVQTIQRME